MLTSRLSIIALILLTVMGCTNTMAYHFTDPDFSGKNYKRILVYLSFTDLEYREEGEKIFAKEFEKYKIEGIPSLPIIMPTRKYADDELSKALQQSKVDAVLTVVLTKAIDEIDKTPEI